MRSYKLGEKKPRAMTIVELMAQNINRLPAFDQKVINYGPAVLAGNASFSALVANTLYRQILNVSRGALASTLPMAVVPFVGTYAMFETLLSQPLPDDLGCLTCVVVRSALIGSVGGGVYPVVLALPINLGQASKIPGNANIIRSWMDFCKPVLKIMRPFFVVQGLFGAYLGYKYFSTYSKLLIFSSAGEELKG